MRALPLKSSALFFSIIILFSSCVTISRTQVSSLEPYTYPGSQSSDFYVFLAGEEIDFDYDYLSYFVSEGGEFSSSSEVFTFLKYRAWAAGANSLINVTFSQKEKHFGECDDQGRRIYETVHVMRGIAAVAVKDEEFLAKNSKRNNTAFIERYRSIKERQDKNDAALGVLGTLGLLTAGVVALVSEPVED